MKTILSIIAPLFVVWIIGLVVFVSKVDQYASTNIGQDVPVADVIVVLTGGSDRLREGLSLLEQRKGKKLFVSGVNVEVEESELLAGYDVPKSVRECCIITGHEATDTIGNAKETAAWIEKDGSKSLHLVTAHYHMPRSMLLFRQVLPDMMIYSHTVSPDSVVLDNWWTRPSTALLLASEYNKYLFARLML